MKKKFVVKSKIDFNKIIKTGNSISNNCFVIYYKDNNFNYNRFGISVGTKLGNAVFRNKYKRKIRMIVDKNNDFFKKFNYDFIILLRKGAIDVEHSILEKKFISLINKLKEN